MSSFDINGKSETVNDTKVKRNIPTASQAQLYHQPSIMTKSTTLFFILSVVLAVQNVDSFFAPRVASFQVNRREITVLLPESMLIRYFLPSSSS